LLLLALAGFTACEKRGEDASTSAANDNALVERIFEDLSVLAKYIETNYDGLNKVQSGGIRSEERRVGNECQLRRSSYQ